MTRPLLVIFLTIFVNLIGFGIIIPLLPFYAEQFGASPIVIGLLFAIFSFCQLIAAPVRYFNMAHDDMKSPPAETRHL